MATLITKRTRMYKPPFKKINYYNISLDEIKKIHGETRPKLLLHGCCGPCSCWPLLFLCPHFDVTIMYNNSNIFPEEEYWKRFEELKKLLAFMKTDYGYEVGLIRTEYNNEEFSKDLDPYKDQKEGGPRCFICYRKRMSEAFDYAEENGFDYFTTVMTISRQKNSQILNTIGKGLQTKHKKCKYFFSDFKKDGGINKGASLRDKYGLYQQLCCGCKYTYEEGIKRAAEKEQK